MDEKELFELIEKIEPEEIKIKEEAVLDRTTMQRIKSRTYEKLAINNEDKTVIPFKTHCHSSQRMFKVVAAVIVIALIIPVSVAAITGVYKYIPGLGEIIETENQLYDIAAIEQIETSLGVATLESFVYIDKNYASTKVGIEVSKYSNSVKEEFETPVLSKATLIINGQRFETDQYGSGWDAEYINFRHHFYNLPSLSASDEIQYEFSLSDGTTYHFNVDLKIVEGETTLEAVGPTDVKQEVPITAKISEEHNVLDVNFISVQQDNRYISDYCSASWSDLPCKLTLIDSQGTKVQGEQVFHNDRNNHFQFNVENLIKPYTINLESVTINVDKINEGGIKQRIKLPKLNETDTDVSPLVIDEFILPLKAVSLIDKQDPSFPLVLERDEVAGVSFQFDLVKEYKNGKRIKNIKIQSHNLNNLLGVFFPMFQGYGSTSDLEGFIEEMYIGLKRKSEILNLYIGSYEMEVQGNWEFIID